MKKLLLLLLSIILVQTINAKTIIYSGFKPVKEERYHYISDAFKKYVMENIKNAEIDVKEEKTDQLEYLLIKNRNFFLASKEFFDIWENFDFDFTINSEMEIRGKMIDIHIQIYSKDTKRLLMKEDFNGRSSRLLSLFDAIAAKIVIALGSEKPTINPFGVDDNKYFQKYIHLEYYSNKLWFSDDPDKYFLLVDELEALKGEFDVYPQFKKLYDDAMERSDEFILSGTLDLPVDNTSVETNPDDNKVEAFARELLVKGYTFRHLKTNKQFDEDDKSVATLSVLYEINFRKLYKKKLIKEIKRRKGSLKFANMGRYFFSGNNNECEDFVDFLLRQRVNLKLFDKDGLVIGESEVEVSYMDFQGGDYKNSDKLPFPVIPKVAGTDSFDIVSKGTITFHFDEMQVSEINKIVKSEIKLIFD